MPPRNRFMSDLRSAENWVSNWPQHQLTGSSTLGRNPIEAFFKELINQLSNRKSFKNFFLSLMSRVRRLYRMEKRSVPVFVSWEAVLREKGLYQRKKSKWEWLLIGYIFITIYHQLILAVDRKSISRVVDPHNWEFPVVYKSNKRVVDTVSKFD